MIRSKFIWRCMYDNTIWIPCKSQRRWVVGAIVPCGWPLVGRARGNMPSRQDRFDTICNSEIDTSQDRIYTIKSLYLRSQWPVLLRQVISRYQLNCSPQVLYSCSQNWRNFWTSQNKKCKSKLRLLTNHVYTGVGSEKPEGFSHNLYKFRHWRHRLPTTNRSHTGVARESKQVYIRIR